LNFAIIEDALSGVFSPDMSREDERYIDAKTCLEDGLAMSTYFGPAPAGVDPLPYVLGVGGGKHLLIDLARQVVGHYKIVEAQAEEFWVGLMRLEPNGPMGREIVAALRASAADLALDILGETGDARVARAILEEGGERAMEEFDRQGTRYQYANTEVQERFNELLLDAHGRLRSARERLEIMAQMQDKVADEKSDMPRRRSGL
jgi:glyoxylate carboligase